MIKISFFFKEFEDPTDPFHPHTRRYQIELNRYLQNVNLNYMPPMPKPVYKNPNKNPTINKNKNSLVKSNQINFDSEDKFVSVSNSAMIHLNQNSIYKSEHF